ncbi:uncharacterized protein LOC108049853 [Drosophila rhopaloa]|uniref:Uncharacterized protein LOC108049853 n=1 Tax=Drosophila rhopaloa TaxID=1041015 RepID=A0A6P4F8W8_DRORH|nr:uncharacterized protein LOC108049853 [Drosophila rhopaloa]
MNKSQKATKVKRGKRHAHTHAHVHARSRTQPQDFAEAEVENARKAVERKLIYLSESNRANAPSRPGKRSAGGVGVGGAGVGGTAGHAIHGGHVVHRRKHSKKPPVPPKPPKPTVDEETSFHEKTDKYEKRTRGGYNVYLESPRRNGLTPRDYVAEAAEMAALLAAQRTSSGTTRPDQLLEEAKEGQDGELGRLQLKPLSSYAHDHHQLPSYSCGVCGAKFHIRSLLGAHRHTHDDDFKVRFRGRRQRDSSTTLTAGNLCKFCDRKFDLERTLHIHQLCHCKKIPPQQRRKLAFTELAHEKKAPLPSFQRCSQHSHRVQGNGNSSTNIAKPPLLPQLLHRTIMQASAMSERWR